MSSQEEAPPRVGRLMSCLFTCFVLGIGLSVNLPLEDTIEQIGNIATEYKLQDEHYIHPTKISVGNKNAVINELICVTQQNMKQTYKIRIDRLKEDKKQEICYIINYIQDKDGKKHTCFLTL